MGARASGVGPTIADPRCSQLSRNHGRLSDRAKCRRNFPVVPHSQLRAESHQQMDHGHVAAGPYPIRNLAISIVFAGFDIEGQLRDNAEHGELKSVERAVSV